MADDSLERESPHEHLVAQAWHFSDLVIHGQVEDAIEELLTYDDGEAPLYLLVLVALMAPRIIACEPGLYDRFAGHLERHLICSLPAAPFTMTAPMR